MVKPLHPQIRFTPKYLRLGRKVPTSKLRPSQKKVYPYKKGVDLGGGGKGDFFTLRKGSFKPKTVSFLDKFRPKCNFQKKSPQKLPKKGVFLKF